MSRCNQILIDILERSGQDRGDGYPLYAYRITHTELERLRAELHSRFLIAGRLRTAEECAAFCLFASEWFRRNYDRGVWKWQTVFDGFELEPGANRAVQAKRADYTIDGLKWWNLDVIRTAASKRYLTTLVCQGGFPLNTLRNDGASLSRVLRQCLRQHELYQAEPIHDIVDEYIGYLPETLQETEVRHLIGQVVVAIADLRRKSEGATEQGLSRREFLDQNFAGWHGQLPFRIDDPEAQSLLLSLLDARKAQALDRQPLAILTTLVEQDGRLQLQRALQHPVTIESQQFRSLCGLATDATLYPRMNGFLNAGETRVQTCTIAKPFEGTTLRMQVAGAGKVIGSEASLQTTLLVRSGQELVADAKLPGGEALPLSPWVFSAEEPFELIGVGSVRTRHESVYVALHHSAELRAEDCEKTRYEIDGRSLYRILGSAEIEHDETTYRIRTLEKNASDVIYELRGNRRRLGCSGSEIWLGIPKVVELQLSEPSPPRTLQNREVFWRPCRGGGWRSMSSDCIGDVFIRADVEGECKLLTRVTVFPESFHLATKPGREVDRGQWIISGLGDAELYFAPSDQVDLESARRGEDIVVDVAVTGERPESITAKIRFSEQAISQIDLVCPTQSCNLVGAAGRIVDDRMGVPLEQLDGLRIRMIQPGEQQPYIMELENSQIIDALSETSQGVWEYPLSFVKDRAIGLLSVSDDPDGEIKFGVNVGRSLTPAFQWKISRYGYRLEPVRHSGESFESIEQTRDGCQSRVQVSNPGLRSQLVGETVKVRVIALNDPKSVLPDESVLQESPGVWRINHADATPGYYLVTGRTESADILRPLRIASKPDQVEQPPVDKPEEEYGFDEVSTIRSRDRRREVWDHFFNRLSSDFGDSDWDKVHSVVDASLTLPITTFEAVSGLTRNPISVARFGILEPANGKLWQRLEELPFLWCLVPVSAWITSALRILRYFRDTMSSLDIPEDQISKTIELKSAAFAKLAPDRHPSMNCIAGCLFSARIVDASSLRFSVPSDQSYQSALTSLIARHARFDSRLTWPNLRLNYSDEVRDILRTTQGLINRDTHANQWAVINAPAIAAIYSVYGYPLDARQVRDFKRLRSFDTEWFDSANYYAMYHLATRRTNQEPDWIKRIVERGRN